MFPLTGEAGLAVSVAYPDPKASGIDPDKYEQILVAATELAAEGGYDALQMRAVCERAGIALATIYRYFHSRDLLIYLVAHRWIVEVAESRRRRKTRIADPFANLMRDTRQGLRAMEKQPGMLDLWARASLTTDPRVIALIRDQIVNESLPVMPVPPGVNAKAWQRMLSWMDDIFLIGVLKWTNGQREYDDIVTDVLGIIRLTSLTYSPNPD